MEDKGGKELMVMNCGFSTALKIPSEEGADSGCDLFLITC